MSTPDAPIRVELPKKLIDELSQELSGTRPKERGFLWYSRANGDTVYFVEQETALKQEERPVEDDEQPGYLTSRW